MTRRRTIAAAAAAGEVAPAVAIISGAAIKLKLRFTGAAGTIGAGSI
jgi:hypothetical protein